MTNIMQHYARVWFFHAIATKTATSTYHYNNIIIIMWDTAWLLNRTKDLHQQVYFKSKYISHNVTKNIVFLRQFYSFYNKTKKGEITLINLF